MERPETDVARSSPPGRRRRAQLRWLRLKSRPFLPWGSLALGLGGAFLLERTPERAGWVAAASVGGLVLLGAYVVFEAREAAQANPAVKWARLTALVGSQSLLQLCLFFSLPFYAAAARIEPGHLAFLALLGVLTLVSLWDPLYFWVARRARLGAVAQGLGGFAAANVVLPMVGVENRVALVASAMVLGLVGAASLLFGAPGGRSRLSLGLVALPILVATSAARVVPPAPLRLERMALGLEEAPPWLASPVRGEIAAPRKLVCASAIAAPRGLRDRLVHRWTHDGVETDLIPLEIRGGREEGFRTFSVKHNLPPGRWRCEARTEAGQLLGGIDLRVR